MTRSTPTAPAYGSLLPLPEPYVVPGGRFREIYYWDSYFTLLGLMQSGRHESGARTWCAISRTSSIPTATSRTARGPTISAARSRRSSSRWSACIGGGDPAAEFARYLPQLEREYAFWMQGATGLPPGGAHRRVVALPDGSILNRYWDDRDTPRDESYAEDVKLARASHRPARAVYRDIRAAAESGWDFGSRWFADPMERSTIDTTEIVPIDLNSLMYGLENAIRAGCERASDAPCVRDFTAARRRSAGGDRPLSVECRAGRVPRLSLDPARADRPGLRGHALSAVRVDRLGRAGIGGIAARCASICSSRAAW